MTDLANFSIYCDVERLRRSGGGAITGSLHVEFGGSLFPDDGWADFVVVVLGWWLVALRRLGAGATDLEMPFMDGPFSIRVTASASGICALEFLDRTKAPQCLGRADTHLVHLGSEVERVARQVVDACISRGWQSKDLDELSDLLTRTASGERLH